MFNLCGKDFCKGTSILEAKKSKKNKNKKKKNLKIKKYKIIKNK